MHRFFTVEEAEHEAGVHPAVDYTDIAAQERLSIGGERIGEHQAQGAQGDHGRHADRYRQQGERRPPAVADHVAQRIGESEPEPLDHG